MDTTESTSTPAETNDDKKVTKSNKNRKKKRNKDAKANKLLFISLCKRFEMIWGERKKISNKATKEQTLDYLISDQTRRYFGDNSSLYQMLRIILPEADLSRSQYGMKEVNIAAAWAEALGLTKGSPAYDKLLQYQDPVIAGYNAAGDISVAVSEVMADRCPEEGSEINLGELNIWLDELAEVKKSDININTRITKQQLRVNWVENLIRHNLCALEHKWIVRIILQKLELGFGWRTVFDHFHPWANKLYNSHSSLKELCCKLSNPKWIQEQQELYESMIKEERLNCIREIVPIPMEVIKLDCALSPMLSQRTAYKEVLDDIVKPYQDLEKKLKDETTTLNFSKSLAFRFPAFVCEAKLDGERMLAHVNRGVVSLQTRQYNWYSQLYSPVIAPAIRRSLFKYDVDVVFDGELISWNDDNQEQIEFGNNRTVAKARRIWCQKHDMIDKRDMNLQGDEDDTNSMTANYSPDDMDEYSGESCWLKYVVFDILYVGGPDAAKLLKVVNAAMDPSLVRSGNKFDTVGSIIGIDLYQRKAILHELLEPQENEVEIVPSYIIRPNGSVWNTSDYFQINTSMEYGYSPILLDSMSSFLGNDIPNIDEIDEKRRQERTDKEIHIERAIALENLYVKMVEHENQEGLVVKDLSSPYYLGQKSRSLGFWRKLKADYEAVGHASDIDVVILGGYYATGLSRAGDINQFLVGVLDCEAGCNSSYCTLGTINGGSTKRINLEKILQFTGYQKGNHLQPVDFGKWYKLDKHYKDLPEFISRRSFQRSAYGDDHGWKVSRKNYPDLWIDPQHSLVLTLNAYEIVDSNNYSAGMSLRFPRIRKIRLENIDGFKSVLETETRDSLYKIYETQCEQVDNGDFGNDTETRFLKLETSKNGIKRKRTQNIHLNQSTTDLSNIQLTSNALVGLTFTVFEGSYELTQDFLDLKQNQGWLGDALGVQCKNDIMKFIKQNGGNCSSIYSCESDYILGGESNDTRVLNHKKAVNVQAIESVTTTGTEYSSECGNIYKWTLVFSLVSKWLEHMKNTHAREDLPQLVLDEDQCIKKVFAELRTPLDEYKI